MLKMVTGKVQVLIYPGLFSQCFKISCKHKIYIYIFELKNDHQIKPIEVIFDTLWAIVCIHQHTCYVYKYNLMFYRHFLKLYVPRGRLKVTLFFFQKFNLKLLKFNKTSWNLEIPGKFENCVSTFQHFKHKNLCLGGQLLSFSLFLSRNTFADLLFCVNDLFEQPVLDEFTISFMEKA